MPASDPLRLSLPVIETSDLQVNRACRIALADLFGNLQPFQDGLLKRPAPVLMAGLDYDTPWTRDAAINVWNGLNLIWPEISYNTLLSVLERRKGKTFIAGQYWDAIIWALGAWAYYLVTGNSQFLKLAYSAVSNSLEYFEQTEFDPQFGLFRGPAVYGDGVSAYPDRYSPGGTSSILDWVKANPGEKAPSGYGIPMMVLSTNCVYAQAYRIADWMALELAQKTPSDNQERLKALIERIQAHFWNPSLGTFNFLVDDQGVCEHQEGLGHAFLLLFDLVNEQQAQSVLSRQYIAPAGIPCVWPSFSRYTSKGGYGRHSGTVWPFISAVWGEAALKYHRSDLFEKEFNTFTTNINRHGQCAEIYHPETGEIYGGLQEAGRGQDGLQWLSCARQSWSASAYLRMLLNGLVGMRLSPAGITFLPHLLPGMNQVAIHGLCYRGHRLDLIIRGDGDRLASFTRNGASTPPWLPAQVHKDQFIEILMT